MFYLNFKLRLIQKYNSYSQKRLHLYDLFSWRSFGELILYLLILKSASCAPLFGTVKFRSKTNLTLTTKSNQFYGFHFPHETSKRWQKGLAPPFKNLLFNIVVLSFIRFRHRFVGPRPFCPKRFKIDDEQFWTVWDGALTKMKESL